MEHLPNISALTSAAAICDHDPGAAPQSTITCPGFKMEYFSLISCNLYTLRHLELRESIYIQQRK